ncbi:NAD-dependent epimerase/dehydratase family protein [Bradyrhizobium sp. 186]|uniref:NAD-dependent epimerase/dehydratase family protein n=1 Tax=Bradyrhizobium sp. 186 TaxID=2782654 RepID=UPI0020014123|nr:NAD-dependent epimerase/dehydratase family protein [Bradyrhizobium sp. 186]UPK38144.1 NAD-dependent epimerase/dehydratase family protein [Bradyrhizobium sp. 186]
MSLRSEAVADDVLVTGVAGFIGFHVARRLLDQGRQVVGLDNINCYYDPALKRARLGILRGDPRFSFVQIDLGDRSATADLFAKHRFARVIHLAAQAGGHLIYASSSSVYGANTESPFSTRHRTDDHPISFYAATKKANELMAHSYSHLYRLPVTGLRFFTVYGPWGWPDMAMFLFTDAIVKGKPIKLFNHGRMRRDFTYIDDVTRVISRLINRAPEDSADAANAPAKLYNVGNNRPEALMHVLDSLEKELGRPAAREMLPMQPGDVPETFADVGDLMRDTGFSPSTPIETGVRNFVRWYYDYYKI